MELSGEEKRIRASFLELRLEDEHVTPQFAAVWNRAHLRRARRQTVLDLRTAAAVTIVCLALLSLSLLSRRWQRSLRSNYAVANGAVKSSYGPPQIKKDQEYIHQDGRARVVRRPAHVRFKPRSQTAKLAARPSNTREIIALSYWQSPTTSLLRSPGDEMLRALPQLNNQTLRELESFLPNRLN